MANKEKDNNIWTVAGAAFVGLIIIGSGIGQLVGDVSTWSTIGVGVGFLAIALVFLFRR